MRELSAEDTIATSLFGSAGFRPTLESLDETFLVTTGIAWSQVSAKYHFEEAIIIKCLMIEIEYMTGAVTSVIEGLGAHPDWRGRVLGLTPAKVFQAMSWRALPLALERATVAGSVNGLSEQQASEIHNIRMREYSQLVKASAGSTEPLPTIGFQIGFPKTHPTGALLNSFADNLSSAAVAQSERRVLSQALFQLAVASKRNELLAQSV
jgi:hypothetical protein